MSINIGVNEYKYPDCIEEIYGLLDDKDKEVILKSLIHFVSTKKDGKYYILDFAGDMSNRTEWHTDAQHIISAIVITAGLIPYSFNERIEIKPYTCPCCGGTFESRHVRPKCELCGKYYFEKKG